MNDPLLDPLHVHWFGTSWGAPICEPRYEISVPVGDRCIFCDVPLAASDWGLSMASLDPPRRDAAHLLCFMRALGIDRPGAIQ